MTSPPPEPGKSVWGLDQNLAAALSYTLGPVSAVIFLLAEPTNRFVRFHAIQCLFGVIVVAVAWLFLVSLPLIGWILLIPFVIAVTGLWIFVMFKAVSGERYKLKFIGEWAEGQLEH